MVGLIILFLFALGASVFRYALLGHWTRHYKHTCGYHSEFYHLDIYGKPCPKCGENFDSRQWTQHNYRVKWPWGWEEHGKKGHTEYPGPN